MKRLLQVALLAAAAKVAYDLVQKRHAMTPLPDGAPYEPAPVPVQAGSADQPGGTHDLTSVVGIGPVFAERLNGLGIDGLAELASAQAETLASALDVSVARVEGWQDQARQR